MTRTEAQVLREALATAMNLFAACCDDAIHVIETGGSTEELSIAFTRRACTGVAQINALVDEADALAGIQGE